MNWVLLSKDTAERWEGSMLLGCLRIFDNYISVMDAGDEDLPLFSSSSNTTALQHPVTPFTGKGYKLGGDDAQTTHRLKQSYIPFQDEETKEMQDL